MLCASETSRCRAESRFKGIDFAEAPHYSFSSILWWDSSTLLGMTKTLSSFLLPCHAELAKASLCLQSLLFFLGIALSNALQLRCNFSTLLFGKCIACIAIQVRANIGLQTIRPYGAGSVVSCSWKTTSPHPFSLRGNGAEEASRGIKARPGNGSGVERGGGLSKRYHMSHAIGVANSIAWQFHPRGTHRVGLFSLDFLWFFLVSRQERTWNRSL